MRTARKRFSSWKVLCASSHKRCDWRRVVSSAVCQAVQDGLVMGADVAMAFAVLLGAGQIADSGLADVAVWAEFLAVDHVQPGIDSHALDATAAEFALRFPDASPIVFLGHAVREVQAAVDELRRRQHSLPLLDELFVGRIEPGNGFAIDDADFDPLLHADDFALLFGVILALEQLRGAGERRLVLWDKDYARLGDGSLGQGEHPLGLSGILF